VQTSHSDEGEMQRLHGQLTTTSLTRSDDDDDDDLTADLPQVDSVRTKHRLIDCFISFLRNVCMRIDQLTE